MRRINYKIGPRRGLIYRLTGRPRRWRKLTPRAVRAFERWIKDNSDLFHPTKGRTASLKVSAFGRRAGTRVPGWIVDVLGESANAEMRDEIRAWIGKVRQAVRAVAKGNKTISLLAPPPYRVEDWSGEGLTRPYPFVIVTLDYNPTTDSENVRVSFTKGNRELLLAWIFGGPEFLVPYSEQSKVITFVPTGRKISRDRLVTLLAGELRGPAREIALRLKIAVGPVK